MQTFSNDKLADLIFQPGISTAQQVSELSGRGVGLDAVRHDLAEIGGSVTVSTVAGQGTCFTILLPLTLAVIDGMIVAIGGETYIVPLADIQEALDATRTGFLTRPGMPSMTEYQSRYIPMADVALLIGTAPDLKAADAEPKAIILVVNSLAGFIALPVDSILGRQQVAVRQVQVAGQVKTGATVLGDGRIAIILTARRIAAAVQQMPVAA